MVGKTDRRSRTVTTPEKVMFLSWAGAGSAFDIFVREISAVTADDPDVFISCTDSYEPAGDRFFVVPQPPFHDRKTLFNMLPVWLGSWRSAWRLRRFVKRHSIGFVVNLIVGINSSGSVPFALPRKVRYAVVVHEFTFHSGEGAALYRLVHRIEVRRASFVIALSAAEAANSWTDKPVLVLEHPFVSVPAEYRRARALPRDRPVRIGTFGRLTRYKGLDLFADAAVRLREKYGPAVEFWVGGRGDEGERLAAVPEYQLVDWDVRWFETEEIVPYIDSIDIFVLPYRDASQSGVLAQVAQMGIPVVVTPVGALPEVVQAVGNGVVTDDVSVDAVADAIDRLLSDDGRYAQLSQSSLDNAGGMMSWDEWVTAIRDFRPEAAQRSRL